MTRRTLVLVNSRADAPAPDPATDVVILDMAWTPAPGEDPAIRSVRPAVRAIVGRTNLFDDSLELLDTVAARARLGDLGTFRSATWWLHARGFVRLKVHELLLWRLVLCEVAPAGRYGRIVVPRGFGPLLNAATAHVAGDPSVEVVSIPPRPRFARVRRVVRGGRRRVVRVVSEQAQRINPTLRRRQALLDARMDRLATVPGAVLAVIRAQSFHTVGTSGDVRNDPYVSPVLERLSARGRPIIKVAIGISHADDADWPAIERDESLIPFSAVVARWPAHHAPDGGRAEIGTRMAALTSVPLKVEGADLGPAVMAQVRKLGPWYRRQWDGMTSVDGLLRTLRPAVLFTGWEAARTSWLAAARALEIPIVAVQHGVIYPNTPDYCRPAHERLVRPDRTCVYGPYERDLLIAAGTYAPETVVVTGSPRLDRGTVRSTPEPRERAAVRRQLGIAEGDRMLVVSTARDTIGDRIHSLTMAERLLGGPLPGVHLVFKIHPEESDAIHYLDLLAGLAAAGGYAVPPTSTVRDIDIYRLLRAADAHLGQYSTVLTDAVLTGTPNMVAVGQAWSDVIGYVAAGVAVPVRDVGEVRAFMQDPRPPTPEQRERFLDAHYAAGDAAGRIADVIDEVGRP